MRQPIRQYEVLNLKKYMQYSIMNVILATTEDYATNIR